MHGYGHPENHHHHHHCQPGGFHRHFRTREERIAHLEEYLKELQAEARAVEELVAELKATS